MTIWGRLAFCSEGGKACCILVEVIFFVALENGDSLEVHMLVCVVAYIH